MGGDSHLLPVTSVAGGLIGIGLLIGLLAWRLRARFVAFRWRFRTYLAGYPDIEARQDTTNGLVCSVSGVPLEIDLLESYIFRLRRRRDEHEVFDRLVDGLRHRVPPVVPPPFPLVQDRLLPVIKRGSDLALWRGYRAQHHPVRMRLTGDLVVAYVVEGQFSMTLVTEGMMSAWGVEPAALHRLAVANLRLKTRHLLDELGGPQTEYVALDGYEASRILIADLIVPAQIADPIVAIPHEHACLVAPAGAAEALSARTSSLYASADFPLTTDIFAPSADGLVPLPRPGGPTRSSEAQHKE